ncbi:MAG: SpoIIE family protein phosphatase [Bacteroidales bacterium]|nr:SpoIIE family protein phosphatase [Bacteroidales bacterium]
MVKRYLVLATLFIGLTLTFKGYSQLYNFTNYSLENGLPQSTIFTVFQDVRGYLWVGTESGVARFNGSQFTVFDRSSGLPGNIVRSIVEGPDGNIWVGTDMGIGIFNGTTWKKITSKDGLLGSAVIKLVPDNKGRVWVATNDAGIDIVSFKNDSLSIENINKKKGLSSDFVFDILHDSNGKSWIAMIGGINMVTSNLKVYNLEDSVAIPSNQITCIDKDIKGNLWFGTLDAGAFKLVKKKSDYNVIPFGTKEGIADRSIWDIFCEGTDQVWFGSKENGLYRWNNGLMLNITSKNGLPGNQILSIYRDRNRNLWLGSMNGLSMFKGFHLVHYTSEDGLPGTQVLAIKADSHGSLWVGGDGKGLAKVSFVNNKLNAQFFSKSSGFNSNEVKSIDFDDSGNLIIGTRSEGLAIMQNGRFKYLTTYDGMADNNINCVYWNKFGSIYAGTDVGYNEIKTNKIYTINEENGLIHPEVQTVISDLNGNIWMGTMGGLAKFHPVTGNYRDFNEKEGLFDLQIHALAVDKLNQLYIGTSNGIYRYDAKKDTIVPFLSNSLNAKTINSLLFYNDTILIAGTTLGFNKIYFDRTLTRPIKIASYDKTNGFKLSETAQNAICKDIKNQVWFGTVNGLTRYQPELEDTITETPVIHITGIRLSFESVDWKSKGKKLLEWFSVPQKLLLKYYQNHITFDFDGLFLRNPEKVRYRYKLEPNETSWSPSVSSSSVTYAGLNNGNYIFNVCATSDGVHWSKPVVYSLTISPPFWKTIWFYILCIIGIVTSLVFYIRWREQKLKKEKEHLEQVVKERTAEVVAQKEHIEGQHQIVLAQKHEITASITYARRIQQAVLPGIEILAENTSDSFVLYKPRDIVSGDFYWIGKSNNRLIVTAADCTGHGVPGAFMSMLGISFMNKIIKEQKIDLPDEILGQMRSNVITSLKQGNYEGTTKDGMDMALCVIDLDTLMLTFAGAYNPAVVISNNEVEEIKADRMPVGLHIIMNNFTPETRQLKKGDCIYLFSDGYQDQMGGPDGRKFMRKNLRELLLSIHQKPFCEQRDILESNIENWRKDPSLPNGELDQMDDILVLGFSI